LKDAARLLGYFAATIFFGALAAPILFWAAQWLAARGVFPGLAQFDFESFFHRALLLGAILFLSGRFLTVFESRSGAISRSSPTAGGSAIWPLVF